MLVARQEVIVRTAMDEVISTHSVVTSQTPTVLQISWLMDHTAQTRVGLCTQTTDSSAVTPIREAFER